MHALRRKEKKKRIFTNIYFKIKSFNLYFIKLIRAYFKIKYVEE